MKAGIITIGNEVLKGKTVNTNAAEIGKILHFAGYDVFRGYIVPDIEEEIRWAFRSMIEMCDLVISSGGLGPTFDDITVASFAKEFSLPLVRDNKTFNKIKKSIESRGLEMSKEREKMALIPEGANVIENNVGTAPGIDIKVGKARVIILPGVPSEMRSMLDAVSGSIKVNDIFFSEESMLVEGIYEATIAPYVKELMEKYGGKVYIKTHPSINDKGQSSLEIEVSSRGKTIDDSKMILMDTLRDIASMVDNIKKHGN